MFDWLTKRRRRRILETPFPESWHAVLERNMAHFRYLSEGEAERLCRLVQVFVTEKAWFGAGGLELTDEIRVTIAGQACLLILELTHDFYANVETIVVYPRAVRPRRAEEPFFAAPSIVLSDPAPVIGEAHERGPLILSWQAVRDGGRHPGRAPNVVYHEFAHKLDMLDGAVDGMPPLRGQSERARWAEVCTRELEALRAAVERGEDTLIDPDGVSDAGEFFAIVTEAFFDQAIDLAELHPELYDVLRRFYRQDPAERQRRPPAAPARSRPEPPPPDVGPSEND